MGDRVKGWIWLICGCGCLILSMRVFYEHDILRGLFAGLAVIGILGSGEFFRRARRDN